MFEFTKMHALGNDFVIIDNVNQSVCLDSKQAKSIADRHTGIGCDQILLVNAASTNNVFDFRIYNQDGSESAQCGNGARCVARLLVDRGYAKGPDLVLKTLTDDLCCKVTDSSVRVNLGVPRFEPAEIPFVAASDRVVHDLQVGDAMMAISALSVGKPHAVLVVDNIDHAPVAETGPIIESHARFPQRTNVGYLEIVSRDTVRLRVYERGVGETFACGSGASAAVVAGIRRGLLNTRVEVEMAAGLLFVEWPDTKCAVSLYGPVSYVFHGQWLAS